MFKLLRRSKNKRSKQNKSPKASRYSANQQRNIAPTAATAATASAGSSEHYRQFDERECAYAVLPTVPPRAATRAKTLATHRAAIEELEDFKDLGDEDDNNETDEDEVKTQQHVGAADRWGTALDVGNVGDVGYFKRCHGELARANEQRNINLAGTAANNTLANVAPPQAPARAAKSTKTATVPATTRHNGQNSHTNSATKPNNKVFAFSKFNVDKINTAATATVDALAADDWHGAVGGDGAPAALSNSVTANESVSTNEEAVWQGHVLPSAKRQNNIFDRFSKRANNTQNSAHQFNNSHSTTAIGVEDAEGATSGTAAKRIGDSNSNCNNDNGNNTISHRARTPTDTVINEVKYRNLGKTAATAHKNSEAKRQSRLSLTLGLGLTTTSSGKSKSVENADIAADDTGRKQVNKLTRIGNTVRKSFLYNRSKSIENELPQNVEVKQPTLTSKLSQANENVKVERRAASEGDRATRAIQKSKEFLSEIFMARGRNRNRNHHQQPQPQQSQTQHHQHQHQSTQSQVASTRSSKQEPSKYAPVIATVSDTDSDHNNQQRIDPASARVSHHGNNINNCTPHSPHPAHLETISDPLSISTNSYQITMSNNSAQNVSQLGADRARKERQERSNSAEHELHTRAPATHTRRALSVDSRTAHYTGGAVIDASVSNGDQEQHQQELMAPPTLNTIASTEHVVIHEQNAELNGISTAGTANNVETVEQDQRDQHANTQQSSNIINNSADSKANQNIEAKNVHVCQDKIHENNVSSAEDNDNAACQFHELTTGEHDSVLQSATATTTTATSTLTQIGDTEINERDASCDLSSEANAATSMGQTNAKSETLDSHANTPLDFRESLIAEARNVGDNSVNGERADNSRTVILPKITVSDCSSNGIVDGMTVNGNGSPVEQEVFYDFENNEKPTKSDSCHMNGVHITPHDVNLDEVDDGIEDEVFQEQEIPATVYQQKWFPSHSPMRYNPSKLENVPEQEEEEYDDAMADTDEHNLDHEFEHSNFGSPERYPLKSTNTSDSNLSNSFPDSGISSDSQYSQSSSSPTQCGGKQTHADHETAATSTATRGAAATRTTPPLQQRLPFVRDGNSTDCDDMLLQYDDLDYVTEVEADANERFVCIESISLPDVVVESTTGASGGASTSAAATTGGEQIININGATGNSMGNVHFIPIHVEGDDSGASPKRRSVDDSVLGSGGKKAFEHLNGLHMKSTIEITEDASELDCGKSNGYSDNALTEKLKRELHEQKSRHNAQLGDAQKNVQNLQAKVGEMQTKIEKLEQELSTKAWKVERLQSELKAALKDDNCVRQRLKSLEEEKENLRHKFDEDEDEFKRKYEELEVRYKELECKYNSTKLLASNLQTQLATAQSEAEEWRSEVEKIRAELEEQIRILKNALENSEAERKICQDKWQKEFEVLRTQNLDREETLMTDCEWQLRQMQRQSKDKIDKVVHERQQAVEKAERLESELEQRQQQVDDLKVYQAEVNSLRGVVTEQERAIESLMEQIENLRSELHTTKENLDEQMKAVKKIKIQCDNAICDKEREVVYRINEVRNQAAAFWENKLYTEMTRLKTELESVYVEERREALDKLQEEHIEELRALTTRYTANEDELRTEFIELQERYERKNEEFLELREKSDNALLQTRMHLDRADREYQKAMCLEEERREALEESLRKEFEKEKEEMEEKFRERLSQVKNEFAKELKNATQEMAQKHRKELEEQKAKLKVERDEALQELNERHRKKLAAAEEQLKEFELRHQQDLQDLKAAYDEEKSTLDKRDLSNVNEIEQLHRKCRCLTNLFEEMRMRYERRDPRPEDLREIAELRSRCESQERDLFELTDRLRELQMQMSSNGEQQSQLKPVKKPPPKTIPTNCDVIYEENEERESPPPAAAFTNMNNTVLKVNEEDEETEEEETEEEETEEEETETEESEDEAVEEQTTNKTADILSVGKAKHSKNIDTINEDDDESHMITAV